MAKRRICKRTFSEAMEGVHSHTFGGDPEAQPYILTVLEREYIAYALALYYQCEHCQMYHSKQVTVLRTKQGLPEWKWQKEIAKTLLFLRIDKRHVSELEWQVWRESWKGFAKRINSHVPHLSCYTTAAIGMARDDEALLELVGERFQAIFPDKAEREHRVADVLETVAYMKSAITVNRVEGKVLNHLQL